MRSRGVRRLYSAVLCTLAALPLPPSAAARYPAAGAGAEAARLGAAQLVPGNEAASWDGWGSEPGSRHAWALCANGTMRWGAGAGAGAGAGSPCQLAVLIMESSCGQGRAGQGRAGQGRAGQGRVGGWGWGSVGPGGLAFGHPPVRGSRVNMT